MITKILKRMYVKLGGDLEDVEEYTKVAPVLNKIVDLISPGGGRTTYSNDETLVGSWIDGKPIYQRTFYVETITNGDNFVGYIDGMAMLISADCIFIGSISDRYYYEVCCGSMGYSSNTKCYLEGISFFDDDIKSELRFTCGSSVVTNNNGGCYITARYTKKELV